MAFKLGLKAPIPGAVRLRFATYLNIPKLPTPPLVFGHYGLIPEWGMLGNDEWGDCAIAGPCHQTMLWTKEGSGTAAPFTTAAALQSYSAITGFNINDGPSGENPTDQGTQISDMADYWIQNGFVDAAGAHHKVVAVMDLNPGDWRELTIATYLFQCVGMGFNLPDSAETQTANGEPWSIVHGAQIVGGHYVPCVGRVKSGNGVGVTWGQLQQFTVGFYQKYSNQGIVALSEEMLKNAKSIDGFDDALLRQDLHAL